MEYYVSVGGDIFILKLDCYNTFSEDINKDIIIDTMKTNKKVVRLTESDLHKLIEEAVREKLNELDWKTKYNAGKKEQNIFRRFTDGEYTNKGLMNSDEFTDREKIRLKRRGKELGELGYSGEWNKKVPF